MEPFESKVKYKKGNMSDIISTFQLSGLHCESCKKIVEKRAKKIAGVNEAETDLKTGKLKISAQKEITKNEVMKVLEGTDYQIS